MLMRLIKLMRVMLLKRLVRPMTLIKLMMLIRLMKLIILMKPMRLIRLMTVRQSFHCPAGGERAGVQTDNEHKILFCFTAFMERRDFHNSSGL